MKTSAAKIYLKTPERKWLWLGGLAACILPLLCALILGALAWVAGQFTDDGIVDERANYISSLVIMVIPLVGTLLATFLGTREILDENQTGFANKNSFVLIAAKAGFAAHWSIAFLLFLFIMVLDFGTMGLITIVKLTGYGTLATFILWSIVTFPVSCTSGYIFWFVAVRGSENLMAEVFD